MAPSQLQIKTNAVARLLKEEGLYRKEADEQRAVVEAKKANGADEYEIKKAAEVLRDTEQMLPQLRTHIQNALSALKKTLQTAEDEDTTEAKAKVTEAEKFVSS